MFELRDYQRQAVRAGVDYFNSRTQKNAIVVMPTGAGKSLIIASIAKELGGHTLVLQPSKEILLQNYNKTIAFGFSPFDVGIYSASVGEKTIRQATFATIGSIIKQKELFEHFDRIIIDECHLVNSKGGMYEEFISHLGKKVLGLTATPYRLHSGYGAEGERMVEAKFLHRTRPKIFSEIVHITQVGKLYNDGFLCPVELHEEEGYNHAEIRLNTTGMDFDGASLRAYNKKNKLVHKVAAAIEKHNPKHALVFCALVEEADELQRDLNALGISSAIVTGQTKPREREQVLADFTGGKIRVVCNVGVLTTGFDFPALDCVILARPTQSVALYYQMVGRGIRIFPEKKALKLIDICGNTRRFGNIQFFEIVGESGFERLKSNTSFLTGFDFVSNEDSETKRREYYAKKAKKAAAQKDGSAVLTFGKFQGKKISEVEKEYLAWGAENLYSPQWKRAFALELKRRKEQLQDPTFHS